MLNNFMFGLGVKDAPDEARNANPPQINELLNKQKTECS
jgi:hypothetical protein